MKPELSRWQLRSPNAVILIVGAPGEGKTVLAYRLADALRNGRDVYCPMSQRFDRPKYFRRISWPYLDNTVIMHNDASLSYHARRYMKSENVSLDQIQGIRRHRNIDLIWDVQNAGSLDLDIIRATDGLILKTPSVLQADTERPVLREKYQRANKSGIIWNRTNAYVFTHKREFILSDISLPSYWNEEISTDDINRETTVTQTLKWIDKEAGMLIGG